MLTFESAACTAEIALPSQHVVHSKSRKISRQALLA